MYAVWVHRHAGVSAFEDYPSEAKAKLALARYVSAARLQGFAVERREHTMKLTRGAVRLTAWVSRAEVA